MSKVKKFTHYLAAVSAEKIYIGIFSIPSIAYMGSPKRKAYAYTYTYQSPSTA